MTTQSEQIGIKRIDNLEMRIEKLEKELKTLKGIVFLNLKKKKEA